MQASIYTNQMSGNLHKIGIFLGAGASWDSGLPLGDKAARYLIQSLFKALSLESSYDDLTYYENNKGINLWPRFEVVIKTFEEYINNSSKLLIETFLNCGISSTCLTLSKIDCNKIWFTTNFDNQIELALQKANIKYKLFANRENLQQLKFENYNCDLVFKLHGDSSVIDINNSLGATIDQILRKFPEEIATNIISQLNVDDFIFIGYAARDPDLHSFITKLIGKINRPKWINLGPCNEKILNLINKDFDYYSEGTPAALQSIFKTQPEDSIILDKNWYQKVDELVSSFQIDSLSHIAADLCFGTNNNYTFKTIEILHNRLDKKKSFNIFNIRRRQIQMLFHTPSNDKNDSINKYIEELRLISVSCSDKSLRNKIDMFISNVIWRVNSPQDSIQKLNSISDNFRKDSEQYVELQILMGIAKIYSGSNLYNEGMEQLENAKELARHLNFPIQEAEANLRIAIALMRGSNPEKSEQILKKTKPIFNEIGNQRSLFVWQLNLAESYRIQRKLKESLLVLDDLIEKASMAEDNEVLINAIGNKGLVLTSIGRLQKGDQEFINVINLSNNIESNKEAKANALYNRGWLRVICCSWLKAIPFFSLAAESFVKDYHSPERRGGALSLLGVSEYFSGNKKKSISILNIIESHNIVPFGNMQSDYKLLRFLNSKSFKKEILDEAQIEFYNEPEQLFYINFMLLKRNSLDMELIRSCIECAKEAKLTPYWQLIHEHIIKWSIELNSKEINLIETNILEEFEFINN